MVLPITASNTGTKTYEGHSYISDTNHDQPLPVPTAVPTKPPTNNNKLHTTKWSSMYALLQCKVVDPFSIYRCMYVHTYVSIDLRIYLSVYLSIYVCDVSCGGGVCNLMLEVATRATYELSV